ISVSVTSTSRSLLFGARVILLTFRFAEVGDTPISKPADLQLLAGTLSLFTPLSVIGSRLTQALLTNAPLAPAPGARAMVLILTLRTAFRAMGYLSTSSRQVTTCATNGEYGVAV